MKRALIVTFLPQCVTGFIGNNGLHTSRIPHSYLRRKNLDFKSTTGHRRSMVSIQASTDGELMIEAAKYGRINEVRYYLDSGVSVDMTDGRETALHLACYRGREDVVQLLLERNADVNARDLQFGSTGLHLACISGHTTIVKRLLDKKADINAADANGKTSLHVACSRNNESVVSLLLANGVFVDSRNDENETALHHACAQGKENIVKMLLDNNADVNAVNKCYETPLHKACEGGHKTCVELLIQSNAIHDARDEKGRAPIEIAKQKFHPSIAELIDSYGETKQIERENAASDSYSFSPSFPSSTNPPTYSPSTDTNNPSYLQNVNSPSPSQIASTNGSPYSPSPTSGLPSYFPNSSTIAPSFSSNPSPSSGNAKSSASSNNETFDYLTPRDSSSDSFASAPDTSSFASISYDSNDSQPTTVVEDKVNSDMLKDIESLIDSKINPITEMLEKLIEGNEKLIAESKVAVEESISDGLDKNIDLIDKRIQDEKDRNDEAVTEILDRLRSLEDIFGPPDEFGPPRPTTRRRGGGESLSDGSSNQNGASIEERIEQLAFNLGITLDPNQPVSDQVTNIEFIVCGKQMSGLITARVASLEEEIGI